MGYFDRVDDCVTVSLHILYTANQETEGSQDWLTVWNTERKETNLGPIFESLKLNWNWVKSADFSNLI